MLLDRHPSMNAARMPRPRVLVLPGPTRRSVALTAALLLVVVGALLCRPGAAAATAQARPHSRTTFERHVARTVLHVLDAERARHGLPALRMNAALCRSARWHDIAMARANRMSHQLPGERPFTARIARAGYRWRTAGENVGWNGLVSRRGAVQLELLMYREKPPNDGHRRNILNHGFRNVGVDIYVDAAHHKLWLTTDFGSR
jgi:uncharacterized protein YkwD